MTEIIDSMARYIANIPDGAVHTCSDLCIKPTCLIVRGKQEIERLRQQLGMPLETERENERLRARLAEAELARDSWKREAELNQQAADESARYAARLAEAEKWHEAALRVGESLCDCGPEGYYKMTPEAWLSWALKALQPADSASGLWHCECGDVQPKGIPCQCGKTEADQPTERAIK